MTVSSVHCVHCGKINCFYRIWCTECQASLPSSGLESKEASLPQEDAERTDLYRSVLNDLGQLVYAGRADASSAELIGGFYRSQLATIEARERELERNARVRDRIERIRVTAQGGRYRQALEELQIAARQFPESTALGLIELEVQSRRTREETARRAAEAQKLALESPMRAEESAKQAEEADRAKAVGLPAAEIKHGTSISNETDVPTEPVPAEPMLVEDERGAVEPSELIEPSDEIAVAQLVEEPETPVVTEIPVVTEEAATTKGAVAAELVAEPDLVEAGVSPNELRSDGLALAASQASNQTNAIAAEPRTDSAAANRGRTSARSFEKFPEAPTPTQRLIDAASEWSSLLKPFLIDNVGWFVGGFLLIAGFVVLIVTFWSSIEQNRVLMHSLVYLSLSATTGILFSMAYYMRVRYPQLESSSNVLLVLVSLLIPLVFAAAVLTMLVPALPVDEAVSAMLR